MPGKKPYSEEKLKVKHSVSLPRLVVDTAKASGDTLSEWLSEAGKMRIAAEDNIKPPGSGNKKRRKATGGTKVKESTD